MNGPLPDDGITTSIWMSKSQRRQLRKLADKVGRITQADRRFFERRPDRQHRIRLTSQAEIDQQALLDRKPPWIPQGFRLFTVVRNVAPGYRMRLFVRSPEGAETDLDESTCRQVFECAATPKVWEIEADTRRMAAGVRS